MSAKEYITPEDLLKAPLFAPEQLGKQIGNALILAPHPDDEVLGCGGLIQFLLLQEMRVAVCFVTSGGASHPNSTEFPPSKLVQLREEEAKNSCRILGVEASKVFFLKRPDSYLSGLDDEKKKSISAEIGEIIKAEDISTLVLSWRRDPHPDHRASFAIGKRALAFTDDSIQLMEYPIWLWKNSKNADWPLKNEMEIFRLDVSEMLALKKQAIHAHQSQTSMLINDDPQGFVLTEDLLSPFITPFEFYFFNKKENSVSLSKKYFDSLYFHNEDPWNFRGSEYEKQKYQTIDKYLKNQSYENGLELGCSIGVHTSHLANHCEHLLSVDISESAIATAKEINQLPNVRFETVDVLTDFPTGPFDLISMCEMGYYFNTKNLLALFKKIDKNLNRQGHFLMVHWTSYVREYPLNGRIVHDHFSQFNNDKGNFTLISSTTKDRYELMLWQKKG